MKRSGKIKAHCCQKMVSINTGRNGEVSVYNFPYTKTSSLTFQNHHQNTQWMSNIIFSSNSLKMLTSQIHSFLQQLTPVGHRKLKLWTCSKTHNSQLLYELNSCTSFLNQFFFFLLLLLGIIQNNKTSIFHNTCCFVDTSN